VLTTTAWVHFPDIDSAVAPVNDLVASGATAVELMVAPALITAAWNMVGAPQEWKELDPTSAALLVEYGGATEAELDAQVARGTELLGAHETIRPIDFTRDAQEIETAWRVREGLQGLVGRLRLPGTVLILEDVCVPPARIAECARDLQPLLAEHGFLPGVAGHASAGNLHFMLTPDFSKPEDIGRYEAFMEGPGRADRRQVRRLAEGRARDRPEHGPLCGARVGDEGDRADVAGEAAGRPRRGALAGRRPEP